jgi:hypothetical protein
MSFKLPTYTRLNAAPPKRVLLECRRQRCGTGQSDATRASVNNNGLLMSGPHQGGGISSPTCPFTVW